ncbi:DNA replication and repair protein RecF [Arcanobacterium hippocoleae]|uniref:DNA replication and repair protein RecF n=2 Tax=Arcanobacterium hippocoleae TaxID=149017 RepID=A0ABU1T2H5_9ACTO|nr:DNA replication and repair protein RecF [Arcanobacterium hippocoleae]
MNIFIGENGQGKTNLVEGINYLATFESHRVGADSALVRLGAKAGVVRAKVLHGESPTMLEVEILAGKANRARINRGKARPRDLLGIVKTVLFAPEDLELVKGDPSARRKFLDLLMIQIQPKMAGIKSEYEKVLRQRAALLKTAMKTRNRGGIFYENALDVWDLQLATLGAQIIVARTKIISNLRGFVKKYYAEVSGGKGVARIDYDASLQRAFGFELPNAELINAAEGMLAREEIQDRETQMRDREQCQEMLLLALQQVRSKEIERGVNLVGPHRDDLRLVLGALPAKGYASHGESWSYALALRLASWDLLRSHESDVWADESEPILILDDVFAELDSRRRTRLAKIIAPAEQVFVTAAVGDDLPAELFGTKFLVADGEVTPFAEESPFLQIAEQLSAESGGDIS